MLNGLIDLPWWGYIVVALVYTHITIAAVTIYLHRCQAHRAVALHPVIAHFFRAWLWLTTGMQTREWTAVHRKHHAAVETPEDPHSPVVHGIGKVLWTGAELYRVSARDRALNEQYGYGTPDDWVERNVYTRYTFGGIIIMFAANILMFGALGVSIGAVQMMWIPFFAAGVINGIGHWRGYRNFETADCSTNIFPWGVLIGGEELHNNHHAFGSSARFSVRPWEFDIGWLYIRILGALGLAEVRKLAPAAPRADEAKSTVDPDTLKAVVTNRLHVMADYGRMVVKQVHREEWQRLGRDLRAKLKPHRRLLLRADDHLNEDERSALDEMFDLSPTLEVVYRFRQRLQAIYEQRNANGDSLLEQLQEWCQQAERTGIRALQDYARMMRSYTAAPA